MKTRLNKMIAMLMAAVFALPAMAQWNTSNQPSDAAVPGTGFQSTSAMTGSGSTYSVAPQWNADGMATYSDAAGTEPQAPAGPRKISPVTPEDDPTPLGDGLWMLLLLAAGYAGSVRLRRNVSGTGGIGE